MAAALSLDLVCIRRKCNLKDVSDDIDYRCKFGRKINRESTSRSDQYPSYISWRRPVLENVPNPWPPFSVVHIRRTEK